jgi:hypothetical protein
VRFSGEFQGFFICLRKAKYMPPMPTKKYPQAVDNLWISGIYMSDTLDLIDLFRSYIFILLEHAFLLLQQGDLLT